jgi:hypothetical protein
MLYYLVWKTVLFLLNSEEILKNVVIFGLENMFLLNSEEILKNVVIFGLENRSVSSD